MMHLFVQINYHASRKFLLQSNHAHNILLTLYRTNILSELLQW